MTFQIESDNQHTSQVQTHEATHQKKTNTILMNWIWCFKIHELNLLTLLNSLDACFLLCAF